MKDKRKVYEEKFNAQLKEWKAQIDLLKAKAKNAKADTKIDYYKFIKALEHKQDQAKIKLQELRNSGDETWETVKAGAEKTWAEIKTTYQDVASRFK